MRTTKSLEAAGVGGAARARAAASDQEAVATRKVFRRLMWFVFAAAAISYLDRINIAFAGLDMNKALGLTATAYGFTATIFYVGYIACEVPSNILLSRVGARLWISRIMITWGLASSATMLVQGTTSLYLVRFLVGVTEAGLTPGMMLYLTFWCPKPVRARAVSYFVIAQALAICLGAVVSGLILAMPPYFGIASWRWLFLIEGLPATLLGLVGLFYLTDTPAEARWLTAPEKAALGRMFEREKAESAGRAQPGRSLWQQLLGRDALLLGLVYFGLVTTLSVNSGWVPLIVREVLTRYSVSSVAFVAAIPPAFAIPASLLWGRSSDRTGDRLWHTIAAFALAAVGWLLVGMATAPEWRFLGLIFCSVGGWCAMGIFWTIPQTVLAEETRPVGIAVISTIGLLSSALTPSIIGILRDATGSFTIGVSYAAAMLAAAALLLFAIVAAHQRASAAAIERV